MLEVRLKTKQRLDRQKPKPYMLIIVSIHAARFPTNFKIPSGKSISFNVDKTINIGMALTRSTNRAALLIIKLVAKSPSVAIIQKVKIQGKGAS